MVQIPRHVWAGTAGTWQNTGCNREMGTTKIALVSTARGRQCYRERRSVEAKWCWLLSVFRAVQRNVCDKLSIVFHAHVYSPIKCPNCSLSDANPEIMLLLMAVKNLLVLGWGMEEGGKIIESGVVSWDGVIYYQSLGTGRCAERSKWILITSGSPYDSCVPLGW